MFVEEPGQDRVHISFRETDRWIQNGELSGSSTVAGSGLAVTAISIGDDEVGPVVIMMAGKSDSTPPDSAPHGHASDTLRIALLGTQWPRAGSDTNAAGALLGDAVRGPMLIVAATPAGSQSASARTFDTEVLHLIVGGACTIGDIDHVAGDVIVGPAGVESAAVIAGPEGLHELIVIGDRRGLRVNTAKTNGWPHAANRLLDEFRSESLRLAQV